MTCAKGIFTLPHSGELQMEAVVEWIEHRAALLRWLVDNCKQHCAVDEELALKLAKRAEAEPSILYAYKALFDFRTAANAVSRATLWIACAADPSISDWVRNGEMLLATWRAWSIVDGKLLSVSSSGELRKLETALRGAVGLQRVSDLRLDGKSLIANQSLCSVLVSLVQKWTSPRKEATSDGAVVFSMPPIHPEQCLLASRKAPETLKNVFAFKWTKAPRMVSLRNCLLWRGYILVDGSMLPAVVRHIYGQWFKEEFDTFVISANRSGVTPKPRPLHARTPQEHLLIEQVKQWLRVIRPFIGHASSSSMSLADANTRSGRAVDRAGVLPFQSNKPTMKRLPLCMGQMQLWMTRRGVLKHTGRVQYGLFLRDVGFTVEGASQHVQAAVRQAGPADPDRRFGQDASAELARLLGASGAKAYQAHSCGSLQRGGTVCSTSAGAHGCPWVSSPAPGSKAHMYALLRGSGHVDVKARVLVDKWQSGTYSASELCRLDFAERAEEKKESAEASSGVGKTPAWFSIQLFRVSR